MTNADPVVPPRSLASRPVSTRRDPSSLVCRDVTVRFGAGPAAIDSITCEFAAGKITSLVGPSGCGKTTLLRSLAGLQPLTNGRIDVRPPAEASRGEVAFVFQQPTLLPWLTAIDNVRLPLRLGTGSVTASEATAQAVEHLRAMELREDAFGRYPRELSGGMKMRVSLARSMVTQPSVLLLDEPFAALDDMLRGTLGELLHRRYNAFPFTIVLVTHNIGEAAMLSHDVFVMRDGRILQMFKNDLAWPRDESVRTSAEFGAFYRRVSDALRGERH